MTQQKSLLLSIAAMLVSKNQSLEDGFTICELRKFTGKTPKHCSVKCQALRNSGLLEHLSYGKYALVLSIELYKILVDHRHVANGEAKDAILTLRRAETLQRTTTLQAHHSNVILEKFKSEFPSSQAVKAEGDMKKIDAEMPS